MARTVLPLAALAALVPFASAGISFSSPKAGDVLTAGTAIDIKWDEGGTGPKIADLLTYELYVVAGGNTVADQAPIATITTQGAFTAGNAASGMVPAGTGENTPKNAYFVKMVAVAKAGGQLITYSPRFSYSGMTGAFPANIKTALGSISGTAAIATEDKTTAANAAAAVPAVSGDYNVAYTMQTGTIRYAPMQPIPPTKITAKNTKPLYPTSSASIARTNLPIPKIQTTLTQSQTFSVSSRENTVAAASHATDDMAKFLNRWKD